MLLFDQVIVHILDLRLPSRLRLSDRIHLPNGYYHCLGLSTVAISKRILIDPKYCTLSYIMDAINVYQYVIIGNNVIEKSSGSEKSMTISVLKVGS
jgi:hypothetical protein